MRELSLREKITRKTLIQSSIFALICGPITCVVKSEYGFYDLTWYCLAWFLAPIIVDAIRPTFVRSHHDN